VFQKTRASFGAHHENLNEDRLYYQRRRCSPSRFWQYKVYADIRSSSQDLCNCSLDLNVCVRILRIHVPHAFSLSYFNCFVHDSYLPIRLPRIVKCVISGDVASEVAKCDQQSIWNPRKNSVSFVRILTNKANISI